MTTTESIETEGDLWDEPDVKVITTARQTRAWHELVSGLVDEARVHFTEYGVETAVVDPANVGMLILDWHRDGFKQWDHPGGKITTGLNVNLFGDIAEFGRKPQDDPQKLFVKTDPETRIGMRSTRPDEKVTRRTSWFGIDPDSLRMGPDPPSVESSFGWKGWVDPGVFNDVIQEIGKTDDHIYISGDADHGTLELRGKNEEGQTDLFQITNAASCQPWDADREDEVDDSWVGEHADDSSTYSLDYVRDMAEAMKRAKMDRVVLGWGDEFPLYMKFSHDEWGIQGTFMLAPRISE